LNYGDGKAPMIRQGMSLVLSVMWNKRKDTILLNPNMTRLDMPDVMTKRAILSATHKVFDLIRFTCSVSLPPKLLLKEIWAEKIGTWKSWTVEMINLENS